MGLYEYFESDTRFYFAFGVFMILVYCSVLAAAALLELAIIDRRLLPLTVGFIMFMFVYFISITAKHLIPDRP